MPSTIGEIREIKLGLEFEWKIVDFFSLSSDNDVMYESPTFNFAGAFWYLLLQPNGSKRNNSIGEVDCFLARNDSGHSVTLTYEFGLKKVDGTIDKKCEKQDKIFNKKITGSGCARLISRSQLNARKSDLAPSNILTIICKLKQGLPLYRIEKLSHDLKELMLNGNDSDFTLRVSGNEFKLHKSILGIRSPRFASVVNKRLEESSTNILDIDDYEETVFRMFLEYIYTGTVAGLSEQDFFGLFEMAEKYEVAELKEDCLKCIENALSVATFFDTISLAEKYNVQELKSLTSKFCSDNLKDLVKNEKWLTFMEGDAKKAYELLSTALHNYVKS